MSVVVIVNIESKQGRCSEALELIKKSQELCLSTDGCTGFEVLQCQKDNHQFMFVERWDSSEIHKMFLERLMNNEDFIQSMETFTSAPQIEYFDSMSS